MRNLPNDILNHELYHVHHSAYGIIVRSHVHIGRVSLIGSTNGSISVDIQCTHHEYDTKIPLSDNAIVALAYVLP